MINLQNGQPPKVTVETHQATPEELAEHRDFVARNRRLRLELRPELLVKYPDQYVALTTGGALLVGDSMADLVAQAEARREHKGLVWDFLNTKPRRRVVL